MPRMLLVHECVTDEVDCHVSVDESGLCVKCGEVKKLVACFSMEGVDMTICLDCIEDAFNEAHELWKEK